ncbi:hypothetical protein EJ02DRAFT_159498 [Clathrospora elynae]|uniref:Med15 multi-domain protein n=1 Tax=Clathrospora elynae TaxID=706981 RepID=A0A6A5SVU7_9PLEO|nr:hypothetical protein EJ02DRAFT_159498 [Clathrospora elynae]
MGRPGGLGLFTARRKSQGNAFDDVDVTTSPDVAAANGDSGGFRLLSRTEVEKAKEHRKTQEKPSKFPRFSGFGGAGNKGRNQSVEDESPGSSKRDSKSSSGTQFSSSRPYTNGQHQHGSTSTLPSSTDTSSDDNLFANGPRPAVTQHNSSPSAIRKQLPPVSTSTPGVSSYKDIAGSEWNSRNRAMTTSSYASTAVPPKLDADLSFSTFEDDMFSHIRKDSPEIPREPGRSLLSEKRTFQAEPLRINSQLPVEPPLKSWDSRGSTDNLMSSSRSDTESPPPPPPVHKYSSYAPVASESPTMQSPATFQDPNAQFARKSYVQRNPYRENSPEPQPKSISSSSANSYESQLSSRSATASSTHTHTTPRAVIAPTTSSYVGLDEDDLFTPTKVVTKPEVKPARTYAAPAATDQRPPSIPTTASSGRVMTQAEFREYQKTRMTQPPADESSDEEDYEDEEEAIRKREEEEILRRKNQQMQFAREAMRRSTTAPANPARPDSVAEGMGMGFPSETSMKAEEWEDEDIPLGILAQHGFPSQARNRYPSQPANPMPSYLPDRPASAGALNQRASHANLPAFARNLPADPYAASSFIGGGLVRPTNRESMGFGRGPASVAGDSIAGGMGMGMPSTMMYHDAGMSQPSLVDQIQMRDMTKQKYMGGASAKKPQGGPFTGMIGQQNGQAQNSTRMSQMPMMNGGNPMMNMMGGQMGGQMPNMGMSMNQMGFPMTQGNDYMQQMQQFQQMQQMIAMQQMQLQMQMQQPQQQDPRISMAMPNSGYAGSTMGGANFLNVPNGQQNRPMSFMSANGNQQQQRSMSFMGPSPGYSPSIAPSERSNIGLSARYRPVVNNSDSASNGTSMTTLQATGGANQNRPVKGILKKASPQINVRETNDDADEDWGMMAARKNKSAKGKENNASGLEQLTRGLNI